jgi:hypothetical protein
MSTKYTYETVEDEIKELLATTLSISHRVLIDGIKDFGERVSFITFPQKRLLGKLYKIYINGGVHVQHDWTEHH